MMEKITETIYLNFSFTSTLIIPKVIDINEAAFLVLLRHALPIYISIYRVIHVKFILFKKNGTNNI